jgi:hypothetical protein
MRLPLTLFLVLTTFLASATDFVVSTNADAGAGSFRDAILQASANGSGTPDRIIFNIADQSIAGRTITVLSKLPLLSSNLIIDGTTQPGPAFGPTNAGVILTNNYNGQYPSYFDMQTVHDVQIYGLWLKGVAAGYAFHFKSSTNLRIGMPGKGNIITGCSVAVACDNNLNEPSSSDVTIQNNIMGTDENGIGAMFNGLDFLLENVGNIQIGGLNSGEGNLLVEQSYPAQIRYSKTDDFGRLNIEGNLQGTDVTGNKRLSPSYYAWIIDGYSDGNGSKVNGLSPVIIHIINNVGVGGYSLFSIASPFVIQGNNLGVGLDNVSNITAGANGGINGMLTFEYCTGGLIGGPDPKDKNWLANNQYGIHEFSCGNITVSRNSFFCNNYGIDINWQVPRPIPFVTINSLNTSMVGGTSLPGSLIELFYDDECAGCEGKTFIGTTTADQSGKWSYSIVATGAIVATATDIYGATSNFSTATINTNKIVVKNASSGRNNGSIKNIEVTSGTQWYWKDAAGNVVANSTDLDAVGPGTYTFVTSVGGADCQAVSTPYTIKNIDLSPLDLSAVSITQPSCGQNNGAITYSGAFDPNTTYTWKRSGIVALNDFKNGVPLTN